MKKLLLCGLLLLFGSGCSSHSDSSSSEIVAQDSSATEDTITPQDAEKMGLEYVILVIESDGAIAKNDSRISKVRDLLNQLDSTFKEDKRQISDMTVNAYEVLEKKGIKQSLVTILEGMNSLFPSSKKGFSYAEYSAAYLTIRSEQKSDKEAFDSLRALIKGLTKPK